MPRYAALFAIAATLANPSLAATYSAKPSTAPAAKRIIGRDISWTCGAEICRGSTESSRPLVLCQDLARRTGRLESFTSDSRALDAANLGKCNARAKAGTPAALATAN